MEHIVLKVSLSFIQMNINFYNYEKKMFKSIRKTFLIEKIDNIFIMSINFLP